MGVRVAEAVRLHKRGVQSRTVGTDLEPFTNALVSQPSSLPEEQRRVRGVPVGSAGPQVTAGIPESRTRIEVSGKYAPC